ncbi:unnamed protein product [Peniophora sp. CBMAI 1063]|nr:unnamed protein product [Peniophora sp. CBMAI 1063]
MATTVTNAPVMGVNSLPNELLLMVFEHTLERDDWTVCNALSVSHVCQRWRRLALAAPGLWSTVPRINAKWTELCLERSKKTALDVVIPDTKPSWIECMPSIRVIIPHIHRLRSVCLAMDVLFKIPGESDEAVESRWDAVDEVLDYLSQRVTPNLEVMHAAFDLSRCDEWYLPYVPTLPRQFVRGASMPKLRDIDLECCVIPSLATSGLLSIALTHLHLRDVHVWKNVDEMIQCLQAVPHLQSFRWYNSGRIDESFPLTFDTSRSRIHPIRCANLPKLKELHLDGSHLQNMLMFSYLSLPAKTRLRISGGRTAFDEEDSQDGPIDDLNALFADALRSHFSDAIAQGACFHSLIINPYGDVQLESPKHDRSSSSSSGSDLLPDEFKLAPALWGDGDKHGRRLRARRFMNTWLTLPIFANAFSINFEAKFWKRYPDVIRLFARAREVRISTMADHLRVLCAEVLSARPCPLPALERLYVEELDFLVIIGLMDELMWTLEDDSPIREVTISRCDFKEDDFAALKALLGPDAVRWDGQDKRWGTRYWRHRFQK